MNQVVRIPSLDLSVEVRCLALVESGSSGSRELGVTIPEEIDTELAAVSKSAAHHTLQYGAPSALCSRSRANPSGSSLCCNRTAAAASLGPTPCLLWIPQFTLSWSSFPTAPQPPAQADKPLFKNRPHDQKTRQPA